MEPLPRPSGNFVGALFDFSFHELITPKVIRVLYILLVALAALASLAVLVSSMTQGGAAILAGLILAPLLFLVYVIVARVYMEILIVIFRIGEDVRDIADATASGTGL
jgi:hypothetical protein